MQPPAEREKDAPRIASEQRVERIFENLSVADLGECLGRLPATLVHTAELPPANVAAQQPQSGTRLLQMRTSFMHAFLRRAAVRRDLFYRLLDLLADDAGDRFGDRLLVLEGKRHGSV